VKLSAIDLLEREMEQEYKQIVEKDRSLGKDFNKAAYEHMKLSKYHFQYLRMQEKMYKYELSKNEVEINPAQTVTNEELAAETIPMEAKIEETPSQE
jgi:hypothetical protein